MATREELIRHCRYYKGGEDEDKEFDGLNVKYQDALTIQGRFVFFYWEAESMYVNGKARDKRKNGDEYYDSVKNEYGIPQCLWFSLIDRYEHSKGHDPYHMSAENFRSFIMGYLGLQ